LSIVPCAFILVGNIYSFIPGITPWFILAILLMGTTLLIRWRNQALQVILSGEDGKIIQVARLEQLAAFVWITLFSLVAFLPRLNMFLFGSSTSNVGAWDETWHLAELVSVARTGLLPHHYLFPTISLSYYYGSWIYPAIIGNIPWLEIPLARAMAIEAYVQTFAFLQIIYCYFQLNYTRRWISFVGLGFFTLLGGFDLFASTSTSAIADWWQNSVGWLISGFQISQWVTL
jgi:hypothetical protein